LLDNFSFRAIFVCTRTTCKDAQNFIQNNLGGETILKKLNYVVVSKENGLYDRVTRRISEQSPNARITRADSVREGVAILEKSGPGVLVTDFHELDITFPETFTGLLSEDEIPAGIVPFPFHRTETLHLTPERQSGNTKADIEYIKKFIRLHLSEDLSLNRLAVIACLTPNYLSALFRKREGESLKKYIERNRMERAAYLLVTENSTMSEIASKVGYRHASYFCSVFRQNFGITPLQFRLRNFEKKKKAKGRRRSCTLNGSDNIN